MERSGWDRQEKAKWSNDGHYAMGTKREKSYKQKQDKRKKSTDRVEEGKRRRTTKEGSKASFLLQAEYPCGAKNLKLNQYQIQLSQNHKKYKNN